MKFGENFGDCLDQWGGKQEKLVGDMGTRKQKREAKSTVLEANEGLTGLQRLNGRQNSKSCSS